MMRADNLKECRLSGNNIRAEGCKHLAQAKWRQLSVINLCNNIDTKDNNPIGDQGCNHIVRLIN